VYVNEAGMKRCLPFVFVALAESTASARELQK